MSGLYFEMGDMYPNMGYSTTRMQTVPEAADQNSLVDDQDAATVTQAKHGTASSKSILISIAVFIVVMVLLAWKG